LICRFSRAINASGLAEILRGKRAERTYGDRAVIGHAETPTAHIADNDPQAATGLLKHLVEITARCFRRASDRYVYRLIVAVTAASRD
jgi:hypothetical protein